MGSPFLSLSLITFVSFVPNPVALVSMDTSSRRLCVGSSLRPVFFSPLREYRTFGEVMWDGVSRLWVPTLPSSVTMPPPQSFGVMDALKALCMPGERSIPTTSSARVPYPWGCLVWFWQSRRKSVSHRFPRMSGNFLILYIWLGESSGLWRGHTSHLLASQFSLHQRPCDP